MKLSGHLLLATVALCCLPALAQDSPLISENPSTKGLQAPEFRTAPLAKPDEPWRIIPKSDKDRTFLITPAMDRKGIVVSPDGPLAADMMCLSIRSYVVKRDRRIPTLYIRQDIRPAYPRADSASKRRTP